MATETKLKLIAVEVEKLLAPETKKIFQEQIGVWRKRRLAYRKKRKKLEDAGLWGEREILDPVGIKYWLRHNNKRPIYYTYAAMAYDIIKGPIAPYRLCGDVFDEDLAILMMEVGGSSDDSFFDTALHWIKHDLQKTKTAKNLAEGTETKNDITSELKKDTGMNTEQKNIMSQPAREIVSLENFMQRHCKLYKGIDLKSRKQALYKAHKSTITLPKLARRRAKGKLNVYYADDLKAKWEEFSRQVNLPPLQSAEN